MFWFATCMSHGNKKDSDNQLINCFLSFKHFHITNRLHVIRTIINTFISVYGCDLDMMLFKWTVILSITVSQVYTCFREKFLLRPCHSVFLSSSQLKLLATVSGYWQLKNCARTSPHLHFSLCSCGQMNNFLS